MAVLTRTRLLPPLRLVLEFLVEVLQRLRSECIDLASKPPETTYGAFLKPKSSILMGLSIINHPFLGTPILGHPHICTQRPSDFGCLLGMFSGHGTDSEFEQQSATNHQVKNPNLEKLLLQLLTDSGRYCLPLGPTAGWPVPQFQEFH